MMNTQLVFAVQCTDREATNMSATTGQVIRDAPKSDLNRPAYARSTPAQSARCPVIAEVLSCSVQCCCLQFQFCFVRANSQRISVFAAVLLSTPLLRSQGLQLGMRTSTETAQSMSTLSPLMTLQSLMLQWQQCLSLARTFRCIATTVPEKPPPFHLCSEQIHTLLSYMLLIWPTLSCCILQNVTKHDFALSKLGQKLVAFREEVRVGRGFQLIRYGFCCCRNLFWSSTARCVMRLYIATRLVWQRTMSAVTPVSFTHQLFFQSHHEVMLHVSFTVSAAQALLLCRRCDG